jgi:anti-sigma B factor antagonist
MIIVEKKDKIDIISFKINKINALLSEELREQITRVTENSNSMIIVNLKGIEYIDSSGFGCLLSVMKAARNNYGIMKFSNPEPKVLELIKTLHLHTVFQIFDDLETCIRSFNKY